MKIHYVASKGDRVKSQFLGLEDYSVSNKWFYYWVEERGLWMKYEDIGMKEVFDTINPNIRTLRGAMRHLSTHSKYLPKGSIFRLYSSHINCDIFITI